jgi:cytochrome c oxidase subunit II
LTSTRAEFQHLFWRIYAPVAGAAVLLVLVAVIVLVLRYRGAERASEVSSSRVVELVTVCVLGAIVAVLLTQTYAAEGNDDSLHPAGLVLDVTGYQWGWTFSYAGTRVSTSSAPNRPPTLVLPADETIEVRLRSRDVIHAFWVPEQRFKRMAFPDRVTRFDLRFAHPGRFGGLCSTFCGLRHEDMTFVVDVRPRASFGRWLKARSTA